MAKLVRGTKFGGFPESISDHTSQMARAANPVQMVGRTWEGGREPLNRPEETNGQTSLLRSKLQCWGMIFENLRW